MQHLTTGRVDVEQQKKQYHFELKGLKVFATANNLDKLSKPLQSRFMKVHLHRYTEEEFLSVSEKVLPKLQSGLARFIGAQVFKDGGDIRQVIAVGRLVQKNDGPNQVELIINTLFKYSKEEKNEE